MTPVDAGRLPIVPEQSGQHSESQASQSGCALNDGIRKTASRAEGPLLSTVSTQARQESLAGDQLPDPISQPGH